MENIWSQRLNQMHTYIIPWLRVYGRALSVIKHLKVLIRIEGSDHRAVDKSRAQAPYTHLKMGCMTKTMHEKEVISDEKNKRIEPKISCCEVR